MFQATINTPGYLPWQDEPELFENTADAWKYLAEERRFQEDDSYSCSEIAELLDRYAAEGHGEDTVYGGTPGYEGCHDLGLAYTVSEEEEPPFDENHYRYHTPAGPNPKCDNCRWLNWQQEEA